MAALVERALERQREMFADELDALREELRPTEPPPSVGSRLMERLEQVALDNMEKALRGEQPPVKTEEAQQPRLSAEDELTLTLAHNSDLLPRIIERMTNTISLGGETPPRTRSMGEQILETVKESTVLQSKAGRAFDRVLNRFLPEPDGGGDDEDGGDESDGDSPEEIANACSNYILEKCAANEPIKFTDEPVKRFAQAVPAAWAELLESLKVAPVELVIGHFSNPEEFPGWYASVLKAPHAQRWIIENLINPAKQPPSKTRAAQESQGTK
jgi:AcrR family transcriptional regulator